MSEIVKAKAEIRDLSSRLYYCSDTGEGRKMRKWIEQRIRELERFLEYERRASDELYQDHGEP